MRSSLEEAQYELYRNGRGNVQDVIIFLSDGAANTWPKNTWTATGRHSWALDEQPAGAANHAGRQSRRRPDIKPGNRSSTRSATTSTPPVRRVRRSAGSRTSRRAHQRRAIPGSSIGYTRYTAIQAIARIQTGGSGASELLQPSQSDQPEPGLHPDRDGSLSIARTARSTTRTPNLIGGPPLRRCDLRPMAEPEA